MPQVLGVIIPIITAAADAASLGTGLYQMTHHPSTPPFLPPSPQTLNPAQLRSAISSAKGDVQSRTSGGVSPDYLSSLITSQYGNAAGNPGAVQDLAQSIWGGGTSFGTSGSGGQGGGSSYGSNVLPFGNTSSGGLGSTGLTNPSSSSGFNLSDWLQQLQGQAA